MAKLNQIIAIEKGIKSRAYSDLSELHKASQKAELFNGFTKQYQKRDEDDQDLPSESKRVQYTYQGAIEQLERQLSGLFQVTARKDWTNNVAKADVVIDGNKLLENAPVSYLLFLEKQITDIRTFIDKLPTLDDSEVWIKDENSGLFRTDEIKTHRTKKIVKPIVLYPATEQHPAQTQMIQEDILAGYWVQIKQSGAIPKPKKQDLLEKIDALLHAVKQAREEANGFEEIPTPKISDAIFTYLFGG